MPRVNDPAGYDSLETLPTAHPLYPTDSAAAISRPPASPAPPFPLLDNTAVATLSAPSAMASPQQPVSPGMPAALSPGKVSSPGPTPAAAAADVPRGQAHATSIDCVPAVIPLQTTPSIDERVLADATNGALHASRAPPGGLRGGDKGFAHMANTSNQPTDSPASHPVESSSGAATAPSKKHSQNKPNSAPYLSSSSQDSSKQQPPPPSASSNTLIRPSLLDSVFHDPWYDRRIPLQTSSYLRPGARFVGTQHSKQSSYEVNIVLKAVDMSTHFLCGYLRIRGLTENQSVMETYFEGEMVSPAISFYTRRPEWNQNDHVDRTHWNRFNAWRALAAKSDTKIDADYVHNRFENQDYIFMRWKEIFLIPDYTVRHMAGASFEGFYYICFNQADGHITGVYYHKNSEVYQQLNLSHSPDWGTHPYYEFR